MNIITDSIDYWLFAKPHLTYRSRLGRSSDVWIRSYTQACHSEFRAAHNVMLAK